MIANHAVWRPGVHLSLFCEEQQVFRFLFFFFYCGLQQLSADTAGETLLGLLLIARLSNGTERINAAEHQRLRLCDTYLIKSY